MPYDPARHHRRSIRLRGYDYARAGACHVTICTWNRECLFGETVDGEMRLNERRGMSEQRILVIPCSGIGKVLGSVGREAAMEVVEDLRPEATATLCLARLTLGDPEAQEAVRTHPVITVDGCLKGCARVNVEQAGGKPAATLRATDTLRRHRDMKPDGVIDLGPGGRKLARHLAEEIACQVDRMRPPSGEEDQDA